jgi:hypothetical protein
MATSSILGSDERTSHIAGKDTGALGPSDNSDSGSDAQGAYGDSEMASDSDAVGTGERATVGTGMERSDADILPDHIEGARAGSLPDDLDGIDSSEVEELASDDGDDGDDGDDDADVDDEGSSAI